MQRLTMAMTRSVLVGANLRLALIALAFLTASVGQTATTNSTSAKALDRGLASIAPGDILAHIKTLASDEFEGRSPATPGENRTVDYLVDQFKRLGLQPGHPDGGYVQKVPLKGITSQADVSFRLRERTLSPALPGECIATSFHFEPKIQVKDSEMVFVGYGVKAPEYQWDDYKDVDVRGKTLVMLVNDPAVPDPRDSARLDDSIFKGNAMTYYGRWTYKYEIAARLGAAAALIVHETGPAGYPYFVLIASHGRENFDLQSPNQNRDKVPVQGWLTLGMAQQLFAAAGHDFDKARQTALRRDFRPIILGDARATFSITNELRDIDSRNVVGLIEGADPKLKHETIVVTAHWDHIGRNDKLDGDQIFNGAVDNATGTAGLLELAQAWALTEPRPRRTVLFAALTAEEKGLLGARYYVDHPLRSLEHTVANINMDVLNTWGVTRDIEVIGAGQSSLEDVLLKAASAHGRITVPDTAAEKGYYFRSDHFEFAKKGVPALYVKGGVDFPGRPPGFGRQKLEEFTARDYHKVSDEVKPDWDLSGAAADLKLLFEVMWSVANDTQRPRWKKGSEFEHARTPPSR